MKTKATAKRQRVSEFRPPLGYVEGANLYEYVSGNPLGAVDPTGLGSQATSAPASQPASQPSNYDIHYFDVQGGFSTLLSQITEHVEKETGKKAGAYEENIYKIRNLSSGTKIADDGKGNVTATILATVKVEFTRVDIYLPNWVNREAATQDQIKKFDAYLGAARKHELGHVDVTSVAVEEFNKKWKDKVAISATLPTQEQAEAEVKRKYEKWINDREEEFKKMEQEANDNYHKTVKHVRPDDYLPGGGIPADLQKELDKIKF